MTTSDDYKSSRGNGINWRGGEQGLAGFAAIAIGMTISPDWVHEPQAAELLAVKPSTLRNMRRERRLDAGTHWVYATGSIGGPVVYNIPAIREMQIQRTKAAVQKEDQQRKAELELRKKAVETYDDGRGLDQLIAEVQS